MVKNLPVMQETEEMQVQPPGGEDPLEEGMATHCSILAWRIAWTEEPGGCGPRVGMNEALEHDSALVFDCVRSLLPCGFFSRCAHELLTAVASLVVEQGLWVPGLQ